MNFSPSSLRPTDPVCVGIKIPLKIYNDPLDDVYLETSLMSQIK